MLSVKVELHSVRQGQRSSGSITIERKRGDAWTRERAMGFIAEDPSAERTVVLENDQRLVIEGTSETEVVLDKEQNAAVVRPKQEVLALRDPDLSPDRPLADIDAAEYERRRREAAALNRTTGAPAPRTPGGPNPFTSQQLGNSVTPTTNAPQPRPVQQGDVGKADVPLSVPGTKDVKK